MDIRESYKMYEASHSHLVAPFFTLSHYRVFPFVWRLISSSTTSRSPFKNSYLDRGDTQSDGTQCRSHVLEGFLQRYRATFLTGVGNGAGRSFRAATATIGDSMTLIREVRVTVHTATSQLQESFPSGDTDLFAKMLIYLCMSTLSKYITVEHIRSSIDSVYVARVAARARGNAVIRLTFP